jgi:tetratricopeptide (TPR) repeat protein
VVDGASPAVAGIESLVTAVQQQPTSAELHFRLASEIQETAQADGESLLTVAYHYRQALTLSQRSEPAAGLAQVLHQLSTIEPAASAARYLTEAEQLYRAALEQDPGNGGVLNNFAQLLGDLGRPSAALKALSRAAALQPANGRMHFRLGEAAAEAFRAQPLAGPAPTALKDATPAAHAKARGKAGRLLARACGSFRAARALGHPRARLAVRRCQRQQEALAAQVGSLAAPSNAH